MKIRCSYKKMCTTLSACIYRIGHIKSVKNSLSLYVLMRTYRVLFQPIQDNKWFYHDIFSTLLVSFAGWERYSTDIFLSYFYFSISNLIKKYGKTFEIWRTCGSTSHPDASRWVRETSKYATFVEETTIFQFTFTHIKY